MGRHPGNDRETNELRPPNLSHQMFLWYLQFEYVALYELHRVTKKVADGLAHFGAMTLTHITYHRNRTYTMRRFCCCYCFFFPEKGLPVTTTWSSSRSHGSKLFTYVTMEVVECGNCDLFSYASKTYSTRSDHELELRPFAKRVPGIAEDSFEIDNRLFAMMLASKWARRCPYHFNHANYVFLYVTLEFGQYPDEDKNLTVFTRIRFHWQEHWTQRVLYILWLPATWSSLQWRHNEHDGVSNHQPYDCLLNRLFRRRFVNSPHKRPVTRKLFPFDDVIMWRIWLSKSHQWIKKSLYDTTTKHKTERWVYL